MDNAPARLIPTVQPEWWSIMATHSQGGVANRDQRPAAGVDFCKQQIEVCVNALEPRVANDASRRSVVTAMLIEALSIWWLWRPRAATSEA